MKRFIADKNCKLSKLALYYITDLTFSGLNRALRKKDVKVNGKRVGEDMLLSVGDVVEVYYVPQRIDTYKEIFCDNNVLVIYKKSGFTSESVYDNVKCAYKDARFIHRLDRNTDGVMIFALNAISEEQLLFGFKHRTFTKKYHALVKGRPEKSEQILTAYLSKDAEKSLVKIYDKPVRSGVKIKTGYKTLKIYENTSLLEVTLFTGKTHQIRAHLAYIGHPIVGDGKYGDFNFNLSLGEKTQKLTAYSLTLAFDEKSPLYYLNGKYFDINQIVNHD